MIVTHKVILRLIGGLGNQLFSYAAARRLSIKNNAELVLDDITGFLRDEKFKRQYQLNHFNVSSRKANSIERLEPFERYRRGFLKWVSKRKSFIERIYLEEDVDVFDVRMLCFKLKHSIYLEGLWQDERYFKDIGDIIRRDLEIIPPIDELNQNMAKQILHSQAVALHVRWFDTPNSSDEGTNNVSQNYYRKAISLIEKKINNPHYFVFSDNMKLAQENICLPEGRVTYVSHNKGDENAYADLWLMSKCNHFVIANSTFSWWGAWLSGSNNKIVVCPKSINLKGKMLGGMAGQVPGKWILI
jgi:Glycosyl transferase family 11